jgi:hypothetical protein
MRIYHYHATYQETLGLIGNIDGIYCTPWQVLSHDRYAEVKMELCKHFCLPEGTKLTIESFTSLN